MHRGDQGFSLGEILDKIGLTASQLPPQYRLEFRERWTQVEVEEFSTKFKTESEAAAKAWVDQCASAQRLRPQISGLVAAGLICMIGGAIIFRSRAKHLCHESHSLIEV